MGIIKRTIRIYILPYIAYFIVYFISKTLRVEFINKEIIDKLKQQNKNIIYVFWHGQQFLMVYNHRKSKIAIMTSLSKDGEIQTKILELFGYKCIRGSSSKGGDQALRNMVRAIKAGHDCAFAIDGPRGPIYKAKPGAVFLAKLSSAVILPVSCSVRYSKIFEKAWDKYILPYPFSKAVLIYGNPIIVNREEKIEEKTIEIENSLNRLSERAREILKD